MKRLPTYEEFIDALQRSLLYLEHIDDQGSIDHEMARWQEWVSTWPKIGTEEGGI